MLERLGKVAKMAFGVHPHMLRAAPARETSGASRDDGLNHAQVR